MCNSGRLARSSLVIVRGPTLIAIFCSVRREALPERHMAWECMRRMLRRECGFFLTMVRCLVIRQQQVFFRMNDRDSSSTEVDDTESNRDVDERKNNELDILYLLLFLMQRSTRSHVSLTERRGGHLILGSHSLLIHRTSFFSLHLEKKSMTNL